MMNLSRWLKAIVTQDFQALHSQKLMPNLKSFANRTSGEGDRLLIVPGARNWEVKRGKAPDRKKGGLSTRPAIEMPEPRKMEKLFQPMRANMKGTFIVQESPMNCRCCCQSRESSHSDNFSCSMKREFFTFLFCSYRHLSILTRPLSKYMTTFGFCACASYI